MGKNNLRNNWSEMRDQIDEWWGDLIEDDPNAIYGAQECAVKTLQKHYGYVRNLTFMKVKTRMTSYRPEGEGRRHRSDGDL